MRTQVEVRKQRDLAYKELERIRKEVPLGHGMWKMQKRYVDALDWVLGEEKERELSAWMRRRIEMIWHGFKHWLLPDHISFVLLFFAILFQVWILVIILYLFTFTYDILEEQIPRLKKLELHLKEAKP